MDGLTRSAHICLVVRRMRQSRELVGEGVSVVDLRVYSGYMSCALTARDYSRPPSWRVCCRLLCGWVCEDMYGDKSGGLI